MKCWVTVWTSCCLLLCVVSTAQGLGLKNMFGAMYRRTENELQGPVNAVVKVILGMVDSNKDGQITFSEMRDYVVSYFGDSRRSEEGPGYIMTLVTFMDENHDDILDNNEIRSALRIFVGLAGRVQLGKLVQLSMSVEEEIRRQTQTTIENQGPVEPQTVEQQIADEINVVFESLDSDKNGLISEEETSLLTTYRMHHVGQEAQSTMGEDDRNGDGALDKSEVTQWVERFHQIYENYHVVYYILKQYLDIKYVVGTEIANLWMDV